MTGNKILDAFSETLMQDERILSDKERELLLSILQNSRAGSSNNPTIQSAVNNVIASAVGETVAQRAFNVLGTSIVDRILTGAATLRSEETILTPILRGTPQPPSPAPGSTPQPPSPNVVPRSTPQPPSPGPSPAGTPQPPGSGSLAFSTAEPQERRAKLSSTKTQVMEAATQCVVLDEFLAPIELDNLIRYTLEHEAEFQFSEVISPAGESGVIDYGHRRSRVLMDLGKHHDLIIARIRGVLPAVLEQLGMEEFTVKHVEAQITASNDGDFFGMHSDDGQEQVATRRLTFVYFFHAEPRPFQGGELRLYDAAESESSNSHQTIVPQQNQIVFFPCSVKHEITPVQCGSKNFTDSRFTLNGWLHK
jgi:Rps23 Pro-64 3,4-dihydroxylase Tpa1-like proline 4-hydroxylase